MEIEEQRFICMEGVVLVSGLEKKGVSRNRIYSTTLSFFDFIDACDSCNSWISRIKPTMIMYGQYVCLEGENICH